MVSKPVFIAVICVGFFLILQALIPKAMALRNPSNVDRFMMEGHKTHKRKNNMGQRERADEVMGSIENAIAYEVEPYGPDKNSEKLSAFIVDYANMIRNDVILLDKSVETRTRKRGNIKVEKYSQMIPDPPCRCDHKNVSENFGEDIFPQIIETRKCNKKNSCKPPYVCMENLYNVTVLKKRTPGASSEGKKIMIHDDPNWNWYTVALLEISVGCRCTAEYVKTSDDMSEM